MIFLTGVYLVMFATAELLYNRFKVKIEITRKFSHAGGGLIAFSIPFLFEDHWMVLAIVLGFTIFLLVTKKLNYLKSVHSIDRKSCGSYLYPATIYVGFLVYSAFGHYIFYFLPIAVLALSDSVAELAGKRWPYGRYLANRNSKTAMGSAAFFVISMALSMVLLQTLTQGGLQAIVVMSLIISSTATFVEAVSYKGWDNLTIPAAIWVILAASDVPHFAYLAQL